MIRLMLGNNLTSPLNHHLSGAMVALSLWIASAGPAWATPAFGQTVTVAPMRAKAVRNVNINQWGSNPLLNFQLQTSGETWGFDVIQVEAQYAPMDSSGRPSTSGWHSHPAALTLVQVLQGTAWEQHREDPNCLEVHPAGTVWFEERGAGHNLFNMDPKVPLVVRITYIIDRTLTVTRTDEADPITGSFTTAGAPPSTVCRGPEAGLRLPALWEEKSIERASTIPAAGKQSGDEPVQRAATAASPVRRRSSW